jgi:NDP-sugar pyrophosphorylase family protein
MAGLGSRFFAMGYEVSKPLLPVGTIRLFELVISNLISIHVKKIILVAPKRFELKHDIANLENRLGIQVSIVEIDYVTEGPASTVELARPLLSLDSPMVVANSDQFLNCSLDEFYLDVMSDRLSGVVITMGDDNPKWSYAEVSEAGMILRIAEKEVISRFATAGVYGFNQAEYFFEGLDKMKNQGDKVNNEYYVGPVYNYLDTSRGPIKNFFVGEVDDAMFGLGTPDDYEFFLSSPISLIAQQRARRLLGFDD